VLTPRSGLSPRRRLEAEEQVGDRLDRWPFVTWEKKASLAHRFHRSLTEGGIADRPRDKADTGDAPAPTRTRSSSRPIQDEPPAMEYRAEQSGYRRPSSR
jgi:hypothetical protein